MDSCIGADSNIVDMAILRDNERKGNKNSPASHAHNLLDLVGYLCHRLTRSALLCS